MQRFDDSLRFIVSARPTGAWLAFSVFCAVIALILPASQFDTDYDSVQYLTGARNLVQAGNPYAADARALGLKDEPAYCCYPPLLPVLWLPLAELDRAEAARAWRIVNLLLSVLLAYQLCRLAGCLFPWHWTPALLTLLMLYPPQRVGIMIGQAHVLVAVLVVGGLVAGLEGKQTLAGVLIAAAGCLKLFPALLVFAFWWLGWRRAALVAAATGLAWVAATLAWHVEYFERFVFGDFYPVAAAFNASWAGLCHRLFAEHPYGESLRLPGLASFFEWLGLAVFLGLLLWRLFCPLSPCTQGERVGVRGSFGPAPSPLPLSPGYGGEGLSRQRAWLAACLCFILLATRILGFYHLNLLLPVAVLLVFSDWRPSGLSLAALALGLGLAAIGVEYGLADTKPAWNPTLYQFIHHGWGLLFLAPQLYGLILVFGVCLFELRLRPVELRLRPIEVGNANMDSKPGEAT